MINRRNFLTAMIALLLPEVSSAGSLTLDDIGAIRVGSGFDTELLEGINSSKFWKYYQGGKLTCGKPYADTQAQRMLEQIALPLCYTSTRNFRKWHVTLTDSPDINACTPGGGIVLINLGLVRACTHETELASVIAHEVGHVEHRHAIRRLLSEAVLKQYGIEVDLRKIQALGARNSTHLDNVLGVVNEVLYSSFKRLWEFEADAFILRAFRQTGYPLNQASAFFHKLLKTFGPDRPGLCLYSSHPATIERISRIESLATTYNTNSQHQDSQAFKYLKSL